MSGSTCSPEQPINRVRRRDRVVEDDGWIRAFLREAPYGVVATEAGGQPFMNPLLFAYDEESNALYFHTSRAGRIFANVGANERVCFCASKMGELIAAPESCRFDVEYESVVVFGRARVLADREEATGALRLLLGKYFPKLRYGTDYRPITAEQVERTAVSRLEVECWSAKRNAATAGDAGLRRRRVRARSGGSGWRSGGAGSTRWGSPCASRSRRRPCCGWPCCG